MAKNQHPEYHLQKQVCQYLELQYPDVLFLSDTVANITLTMGQRVRNKAIQKDGFACPDLLILEPMGEYHGLFIELKHESIFLKDGITLKKQSVIKNGVYQYDHLERQQKSITALLNKGYYCCFSVGFENTKQIIDSYMKLTL